VDRDRLFADDARLDYEAQAFRFAPGRQLRLDRAYRVRQLPLVDATHPAALSGDGYERGRYAVPRLSLALFLAHGELEAQAGYRRLLAALEASPVGRRIAWDTARRRRDRLHATVCPGLDAGDVAGEIARIRDRLRGTRAFRIRVAGPWLSDAFNTGRLYLPVYPELRGDADAVQAVQRRVGCPERRFYAIGWQNLLDDLSAEETGALGAIVEAYRATVLLETVVSGLEVVLTHDDLLLDSRRVHRFPLDGRG
jgi:hypothetical protein